MTHSLIGHNGPPFEATVEMPPDLPKLHYFKLDIQALRKAIFDKPLEQRGAFISVLLAMYEFMEPLPADDNVARMRCGIMDMRVYRRVKRELVAMGLAHLTASGRLSNRRFEEEIEAYITDFTTRQKAARAAKVASAQREPKPDYPVSYPVRSAVATPLATPLAKPELTPQLSHDLSEKYNEINGCGATTGGLRARDLKLELLDRRERKDILVATTPPVAAATSAAADTPRRRRSKLPEDWVLPKAWGEWALAHFEVTPEQVRTEAAKFRDHWLGTGEPKADWQATWRNWCRSPWLKWRQRAGVNGHAAAPDLLARPEPEPAEDAWAEVREEQRRRREAER